MNEITMGFAQVDITPTASVELAGFYRPDDHSRGILDPLALQVLLWRQGEESGCLIAIDSLGWTVELAECLRDAIAVLLKTQRDHIMLCFSHTHSAPNAAKEPVYFKQVCAQAETAVRQASMCLRPVKAVWGSAENPIGENRRSDPDAMDRRLGLLKLTDLEGHPVLILLRVSTHANILFSDNYLISADYFGRTRQRLSRQAGCPVMMIQGASGDIRPRYCQQNTRWLEVHSYEAALHPLPSSEQEGYRVESLQALEKTAELLTEAAWAGLKDLKPRSLTSVQMTSVFCSVQASVPDWNQAEMIAKEAWAEAGIDGRAWLGEVRRLHQEGVQAQHAVIELQLLKINDGGLCGVANEIMSNIALQVQARTKPLLFFNGYTNGCSSYLPDAKEYDAGGYEVLWSNLIYFPYHGRVMPLDRDTAVKLADAAAALWRTRAEEEKNAKKLENKQTDW